MTYELAKKLKDAGFPQGIKYGEPYVPNLSELIEACGEGFTSIERSDEDFDNVKKVFYKLEKPVWQARADQGIKYLGHGSTAEEAVANLWLALNPPEKKKEN